MEAGVPIPVPSDLVMLLLGERVSAGALPLWVAAAALELVALIGTAALFLAARGPRPGAAGQVADRLGKGDSAVHRVLPVLVAGAHHPGACGR
jgi:hypothetical protein